MSTFGNDTMKIQLSLVVRDDSQVYDVGFVKRMSRHKNI